MGDVVQIKKGLGVGKWVLLGIVVMVLLFKAVVVIPAGTVGIPVLFGKVQKDVLKAGIHVINPLLSIVKMNVRTQEITEEAVVPSKEGLSVTLDVTLLFALQPQKASEVYKTIGPRYVNVVVEPQFRSIIRGATASYEAKSLYTSQREVIAN
ncbi:MAG: SPFH domain-containing protein, partial [bacterium]|nr:SPFH domain-containing protein [bacterium]